MVTLPSYCAAADLSAFYRGAWPRAIAQAMAAATLADLYHAGPVARHSCARRWRRDLHRSVAVDVNDGLGDGAETAGLPHSQPTSRNVGTRPHVGPHGIHGRSRAVPSHP